MIKLFSNQIMNQFHSRATRKGQGIIDIKKKRRKQRTHKPFLNSQNR